MHMHTVLSVFRHISSTYKYASKLYAYIIQILLKCYKYHTIILSPNKLIFIFLLSYHSTYFYFFLLFVSPSFKSSNSFLIIILIYLAFCYLHTASSDWDFWGKFTNYSTFNQNVIFKINVILEKGYSVAVQSSESLSLFRF